MASRESQGLQIALIIFVMVTVVLAVTTFVFYSKSERLRKEKDDAGQQAAAAKKNYDTENFKVQYLKHVLGAAPLAEAEFNLVRQGIVGDQDMKGIDDLYQQHMATYGEGLTPEKLNYRDLLPNLIMALKDRNVQNASLSEQVTQLSDEKKQIQEDETKRTQDAVLNLQKARDDLAARQQEFEKDRAKLAADQQKHLETYKKERNDLLAKVATSKKTDDERQVEVKNMQTTIDQQRDKLKNMEVTEFEVPDGQITWVNQRTQTVWINLGTADALRRQTLFSVYGQEENGVTRAERKASVEVTRVLDEHLAEARIVFDEPSDPILPGDQIFSPAWRPGTQVHFALAGLLDVNGDKRGDRELVRNLILSNGAEIDAEVTETGESIGEITPATRYLVRGTAPVERSDPKALSAWTKINQDAQQLGVEVITLDKLLSWMGYKQEVQTIQLGSGARSADFKPGAAGTGTRSSTGNVSDTFAPRRPPTPAAKDSTF